MMFLKIRTEISVKVPGNERQFDAYLRRYIRTLNGSAWPERPDATPARLRLRLS